MKIVHLPDFKSRSLFSECVDDVIEICTKNWRQQEPFFTVIMNNFKSVVRQFEEFSGETEAIIKEILNKYQVNLENNQWECLVEQKEQIRSALQNLKSVSALQQLADAAQLIP